MHIALALLVYSATAATYAPYLALGWQGLAIIWPRGRAVGECQVYAAVGAYLLKKRQLILHVRGPLQRKGSALPGATL